MKILLVFPRIEHGASTHSDKGSWSSILFGYPIITLPHLAGITPEKHKVTIVNENYDTINYNSDVDLVGITCYTMTAPRVYEIADEFRRRGKKVVLGGYHPTAMPEEAKQHADSVVLGEAELSWPQLIKDLEKGKLQPFYAAPTDFDAAVIPALRRDLIRHNPWTGAVQSSRGCPNECEFCAITSFCKHGLKQRPIKDVVAEIKQMPNKHFIFHDPSLTVNPKYSRALFKELIRQKVRKYWVANGNANVLGRGDKEFLELAHRSGCVEWFVGFESISQKALDNIKKTSNNVKDFEHMIKRVHQHGMTVQGGIIFGFDEDTPDVFDTTLETLYAWDLDVLEVNILTPYPGTPLFDRFEREGRILSRDWSRYNQVDVVFQPKQMSVKELYEGSKKVAREFYHMPRIIRRMIQNIVIIKRFAAIIPAGTNLSFRTYYKRDYNF
jgi:radical SAM superfamily enzyme YgiQ (UPF0313 family)